MTFIDRLGVHQIGIESGRHLCQGRPVFWRRNPGQQRAQSAFRWIPLNPWRQSPLERQNEQLFKLDAMLVPFQVLTSTKEDWILYIIWQAYTRYTRTGGGSKSCSTFLRCYLMKRMIHRRYTIYAGRHFFPFFLQKEDWLVCRSIASLDYWVSIDL